MMLQGMALRQTQSCLVSRIQWQSHLNRKSKNVPPGNSKPSRLGEPEDITGAILFLTSDDAAFITGQAIVGRRSVSDRLGA
jgi:NAD(P)-dependent dehydrogenase (short-subunit alcohol dehydrogenase family)